MVEKTDQLLDRLDGALKALEDALQLAKTLGQDFAVFGFVLATISLKAKSLREELNLSTVHQSLQQAYDLRVFAKYMRGYEVTASDSRGRAIAVPPTSLLVLSLIQALETIEIQFEEMNNRRFEKMKNFLAFIASGRNSLAAEHWHSALFLALSIPDICSSLETPDERPGRRYIRWAERWLVPKWTIKSVTDREISERQLPCAKDLWLLRNSLIHSGQDKIEDRKGGKGEVEQIAFYDGNTGSHRNTVNNTLQLNTEKFCEEIFSAASDWANSDSISDSITDRVAAMTIVRTPGSLANLAGSVAFG